MIKGQVWDLTGEKLVGAHAYNGTRHYGTFTDINGIFFLVMSPGDSLRVTMVGYKPYRMRIPARLEATSYKLDITLAGDTILLKTAEIKPYPETYAELKRQFVKLKVDDEKWLDRTRMPDVVYRSKYANPDGSGLILPGPFSLLYNTFSKEAKELKKMNAILATNRVREKLLTIITKSSFEKELGIKTDDQIDILIKRCGITIEFLNSTPEYRVIEYIMDCSRRM
ncbi:MAG TPA: hypothetical protein VK212_05030 [Lentimicrobium sp.]|nr:hypothetical protein [Lentimicrobium sp.]